MAFPTTGILDAFNRADENPLTAATWGTPIQSAKGSLKIVSTVVAVSTSGTSQQYWSVSTFGPDVELFMDVPTLPATTKGLGLYGRVANPGNASTATAYGLAYTTDTGFGYYKFTVGTTFTQLGSTDPTAILAGDSIGLQITGGATTTLAGFRKTGGTWSPLPIVPTVTDSSSPITAAGFIALEMNDTTARTDNFGGGTVVTSSGVSGGVGVGGQSRTRQRVRVFA
jgi:hypothetical protein